MNETDFLIVNFLGGKSIPQKASTNPKSNNTLDYSNYVFEDKIVQDFSSLKSPKFDSDWNLLMIVRRKLIDKGFDIQLKRHCVYFEYKHGDSIMIAASFQTKPNFEINSLYDSIISCICFYNNNSQLFK